MYTVQYYKNIFHSGKFLCDLYKQYFNFYTVFTSPANYFPFFSGRWLHGYWLIISFLLCGRWLHGYRIRCDLWRRVSGPAAIPPSRHTRPTVRWRWPPVSGRRWRRRQLSVELRGAVRTPGRGAQRGRGRGWGQQDVQVSVEEDKICDA